MTISCRGDDGVGAMSDHHLSQIGKSLVGLHFFRPINHGRSHRIAEPLRSAMQPDKDVGFIKEPNEAALIQYRHLGDLGNSHALIRTIQKSLYILERYLFPLSQINVTTRFGSVCPRQ